MSVAVPLLSGHVALVDETDLTLIQGRRWYLRAGRDRLPYVVAKDGKYRQTYMHRLIMGAVKGQLVDHKNGCTLDNTRGNLRFATPSQNCWNSGPRGARPFKGPTRTRSGRWMAFCNRKYIGSFDTQEEAARAYDTEAMRLFGEFARLNFPKEQS